MSFGTGPAMFATDRFDEGRDDVNAIAVHHAKSGGNDHWPGYRGERISEGLGPEANVRDVMSTEVKYCYPTAIWPRAGMTVRRKYPTICILG
jgi:hypothetical protein